MHTGAGDDTTRRRAVLAGVVIRGLGQTGRDGLDVGIVEHHDRRLAPELEMHPLEGVGGVAGDELAGVHVAGEREHGDARMTHDGVAGGLTLTGDHVEHTRGKDALGEFGETQRAERCEL